MGQAKIDEIPSPGGCSYRAEVGIDTRNPRNQKIRAREIELATLLNPRVLSLARELDIVLVNFATLPTLLEKNNVAA